MTHPYKDLTVELFNDHEYSINSADNVTNYTFIYGDLEDNYYHSSQTGVRVLQNDEVVSAIIYGMEVRQVFTKHLI